MLWLAAIAVPLLAVFLWWSWRKRQHLTKQFVQARLLAQLTVGVSASRLKLRLVLLILAVALLFVALARPMWSEATEEVRQHGLDIVVAIDTSRSMLAEDITPNRLERSKLAALDLMRLAKQDRLGLVAFAGTAFLQCPLTLDEEAFRQSVNALEVGIVPQGGTALAEAIETSLTAFKEEGENIKVLVLFTDGEDHEPGALEAAQKAARAGMRIFTVGVGTANGELLRVRDEKGNLEYIKDDQSNVVKSRLNQALLTQIATATEGSYIGLTGANTMDVLYRKAIAPLPRAETTTRMIRHHKEQYLWPLSLAMLVLLLEMFLPERKRVERRVAPASASANEELRKAVAILGACFCAWQAAASPGSALREYEDGHFREAQKEFQKLAEKHPEDARLQYNAGAAAYQAKQFEQAAKHFMTARNPDNLALQQSAYYNLGNTHFRLGEQQNDSQHKMENWQQAAQDYESALKLNPQDSDAKFNLEFVKTKLEELQKQQKQSQQQNQKQDQSKDEKNQQKQDKTEQQQQNKDQQSEPKDDQQQEQKQQQQQSAANQPDQKKPDESQQAAQNKEKPDDRQRPEDNKSNSASNQPGQEQGEAAQAAAKRGQMTKEQVEKLLDAQKGDEKAMIFQPPEKGRTRARVFKDW